MASAINHPPNVFVKAVSLFSRLRANIFPGSIVLGTWGIHEEALQSGHVSSFKMGKHIFGLLFLCQLGLRCKVTHKLRPRCLHDMCSVSSVRFETKWTHYLLFTVKNHGPACHHEDNHSSCFQFRTGSEGCGIPRRVQLAHQVIVIRRTWFRSLRSHLIVHLQEDESIEVTPSVKGMREIWMKNIIQIIFSLQVAWLKTAVINSQSNSVSSCDMLVSSMLESLSLVNPKHQLLAAQTVDQCWFGFNLKCQE